jgi:predicted nucleic-acid-binding Zn-ribbon protein
MNIQQSRLTKTTLKQPGTPVRKYKRRHTRIHLDSLKPTPTNFLDGSLSECPKCQGFVFFEAGETTRQTIIRCLNCGWQPHYQAPKIQETEAARTMRTLTNQFVSGCDWDRLPIGW